MVDSKGNSLKKQPIFMSKKPLEKSRSLTLVEPNSKSCLC